MIYYKERNYFAEHGKFTSNLDDLGLKKSAIDDYSESPVIECTSDMFEAYLQSNDGDKKIHIRNDGLTWITNKK